MGKIALVFPGQGSQYVGMGKELYENNEVAKKVMDKANDALHMDLLDIMFNGPDSELTKTENTQPSIVTLSIALLEALKSEIDFDYDGCAGLSLGEYAALVAANSMEFEDAVKLVKKRGKYMQEAVPVGTGGMAAILGFDRESLSEVVKDASTENEVVEVANFNSPGQIVISGELNAVQRAVELCKERGAKKSVMLNVSAPFHSSMLKPAGIKLGNELEGVRFNSLKVPVIANANAGYYEGDFKDLLIKQVSSSVLWEDSIEKLIEDGYDTFVEIGPGKTLKGFIKKISSTKKVDVKIHNIEDSKSLNEFVKLAKEGEI